MIISNQVFTHFGDLLIANLPATLAAIAALITALRNSAKTDKVKNLVNGRMDQLLAITKELAHKEGRESIVQQINNDPKMPNIEIVESGIKELKR